MGKKTESRKEMSAGTAGSVSMCDESAIYYSFAIGSYPDASLGTLTLDETALAFASLMLGRAYGFSLVGLHRIVRAEVKRAGHGSRRRFVWIIGAILIPLPFGVPGLRWLARFWQRIAGPTLEVYVRRWWFVMKRVYIVQNPEEWADAINRLVAAGLAGEGATKLAAGKGGIPTWLYVVGILAVASIGAGAARQFIDAGDVVSTALMVVYIAGSVAAAVGLAWFLLASLRRGWR